MFYIKIFIQLIFAIILINPSLLLADRWENSKPKICLVLKGGGALGFAHVGVLRVLEKNRIPIHCIAGASMGSIVGAAYASGNSMDEINEVIYNTDWVDLFGETINRSDLDFRMKAGRNREIFGDTKISIIDGKLKAPTGVVQGQNIRLLFQKLFGNLSSPINFDSLPIPFRAIATDIETAESFVPSSGDLSKIVRASMSVPGAFAPIEIEGKVLVDGGLSNNLPVDVALNMGADILIVVDLQSDLAKKEELTNPFSITGQMISMLFLQNTVQSLKLVRENDILIEPNVRAYSVTSFDKATEIALIGEEATNKIIDKLKLLSITQEGYKKYQELRVQRIKQNKRIDFIKIKNDSNFTDKRIKREIKIKAGEDFDVEKIEASLKNLYKTGYFKTVQYNLIQENNENILEIEANGKKWLDKYFRMGFSLEDDFEGENNFRLATAFRTKNPFFKEGYMETQIEIGQTPTFSTELYQPLAKESQWFFNPKLQYARSPIFIRDGETQIAEYLRSTSVASLGFGRRISNLGEATVFINKGVGDIERLIGDTELPEFDYDISEIGASLSLDTQDKPDFPTTGYSFNLGYLRAQKALGDNSTFDEITGSVVLPITFDRNTFIFRNSFGTTLDDRPVERSFNLGGFLSISGAPRNSLIASDYNITQAILYRRFAGEKNPFFDLAFYLGGSLESTYLKNDFENLNDFGWITSGSIFFGADTPLLPIYLSFGLSDNNDKSVYLVLGRIGN